MATIRRRGSKFQVQVRRLGSPALSKTFLLRKDAELWARQMEIQADRKELPANPKKLRETTLADLVVRYRDTITPRKRGRDVEAIVLTAFLRQPICRKTIDDLSPSDFAAYRDQRLARVKPNTLSREFAPLHNLFEVARHEWGLPIRDNPVSKVRIENTCFRRQRRLRDGELGRIVGEGKKSKNPYLLSIALVAIETALRRSEILSATWGDLDTASRLLTVPKPKNGHSRMIPLSGMALGVFEEVRKRLVSPPEATTLIFPVSANAFRLAWGRLLARAKIQDLHFHDLRHEAISRLFEVGLTTPEVALISGHRDPRMLFRYTHPQHRRIIEQLDKTGMGNTPRLYP